MSVLLVDCETFSKVDVTQVGSYEYANHPSTRVTLWALRDPEWPRTLVFEEPNIWKLLKQLKDTKQIGWTKNEPLDLIHWSPFDQQIVEYSQTFQAVEDGWDHDSPQGAIAGPNNTFWCDLSTLSLIYGGPMKLKHAAKFWGGTELKDEGKHLISRFCKPNDDGSVNDKESDPIRWEQFRTYAAQDVSCMVPILNRFQYLAENGGEDPEEHWPYIRLIGRMNERGVPIDLESARVAQDNLDVLGQKMKVKCEKVYGFTAGSIKAVREYLGTEDCKKETIEEYIDAGVGTKLQLELAEIRLVTSGTAAKKIVPMLKRSKTDGRARGCFIYHGAATNRLVSTQPQFHNMLRASSHEDFFKHLRAGKIKDDDLFSKIRSNIRGFVQCKKDKVLVAADFSQVELRVGAGIAGEDWLTEAFKTNRDPYLIMASEIYGESITSKADLRRQFGKIVELACLFGLGRFGLMKAAKKEGIVITEAYAQTVIDTYRRTHQYIVMCWAECSAAFKRCMFNDPGYSEEVGPLTFERIESAVKLVRPSGFAQYYWLPRLEKNNHWDNCNKPECDGCKEEIAFVGRNQGGVMSRKTTYGGDLFQSAVQGTAADLMLHGMMKCEAAGYPPIMSVHDEVVCEIEEDGYEYIEDLCDTLCDLPDWADALPAVAEGWQQRRFTK